VCFAGALFAKHRVKTHQLENIDRLKPQLVRDPNHGFIADEPKMLLPKMEQRHGGAALSILRVAGDRLVHFPL